MKHLYRLILFVALLAGAVPLRAQTFGLSPVPFPQFDTNGQPLSGGLVYTCLAGTTCPGGSPLSTFTSSSGASSNTNPIVLNTAGYASVWLNTSLFYRFTIERSDGTVLYVIDNISASSGGGGGGGTNYWSLSGSSISNSNGGGAGNVSVGANFAVGGDETVGGGLLLSSSGFAAKINATAGMTSNVFWRWPKADAIGCMSSDGSGNLTFAACGGGGSGSPTGPLNSIQSNNPTGSFYGDANFVYTPASSPPLVALTGVFQSGGTTGGFNAPAATATNAIQAPVGGVTAKWLIATDSVFWTEEAAPAISSAGQSKLYADSTTHNVLASMNGAAFRPVALTDAWASMMNGDCVSITVTAGVPYLVDAGGACTTGGGGGTVSSSAQFNVGYYTAAGTGTTIGGDATYAFCPACGAGSTPAVTLDGNFQTVGVNFGFNATTCTLTNCVQVPSGGVTGKWVIGTDSMFLTEEAAPAVSSASQSRFYADSTAHTMKVSQNGAAYLTMATYTGALTSGHCVTINSTTPPSFIDSGSACGGGGGATPGGSDTSVQYNRLGVMTGDANLEWLYTAPQKFVITTSAAAEGLKVVNGYATADGGFNTSSTSTTAIQAPNGQIFGKTMFVSDSYLWQQEGAPALSGAGQARMYADFGGAMRVSINGGAYTNLATGGVSSVNGLTGALGVVGTGNEINVSSVGTTITLSTPQAIGTGSAVTFGSVTSGSAFSAAATGTSITYQNSNGLFQVNGNGAVSAAGAGIFNGGLNAPLTNNNAIQTTGGVSACTTGACAGGSAFSVVGATVINSSGVHIGPMNTGTSVSSVIWVGGSGNFYNRATGASSGISCGAILDGWTAITSDNFVVVCQGGSRFRAALTAY